MDIEIVEFYIIEKKDEEKILKGSMHIYLPEIDADIRGVMVLKKKNAWFFALPSLFGRDPETKEKIRFSTFSFLNKEKNDELKKIIKKKGKEYIIKNFLSK